MTSLSLPAKDPFNYFPLQKTLKKVTQLSSHYTLWMSPQSNFHAYFSTRATFNKIRNELYVAISNC